MPIEGVSDIVRIPRLGKIRLGVKVDPGGGKATYPKAVDYFVCPPAVLSVFGEQPKELRIIFPLEDELLVAQQWLRCYSHTQGCICWGNGVTCTRKVDISTGSFANHETEDWQRKEGLICNPQECEMFTAPRPQCKKVMNLQFMIPEVEGIGVWQIDTSSFHSIVTINNSLRLIRAACGRISFIPLFLTLAQKVVEPAKGKTKTVWCLGLECRMRLADLQRLGLQLPTRAMLPPVDTEEPPDDLFPEGELVQAEKEREAAELERARNDLGTSAAKLTPKKKKEAGAKKPPLEDPFFMDPGFVAPAPSPLQEAWNTAMSKLKQVDQLIKGGISRSNIIAWLESNHKVKLSLEDFNSKTPPECLTEKMLSSFVDQLQDYEDRVKPRQG